VTVTAGLAAYERRYAVAAARVRERLRWSTAWTPLSTYPSGWRRWRSSPAPRQRRSGSCGTSWR